MYMYKKSNKKTLTFLVGLSIILSSLILGFIGGLSPKVSAESSSSSSNSTSSSSLTSSSSSSPYSSSSTTSSYQQDCKWAITIFGYAYYVVVPCGTPLSISADGPILVTSSSYSSSSSSYDNYSSVYSSSSYPYSSYSSVVYDPSSSSSSSYSSYTPSSSSSYSSLSSYYSSVISSSSSSSSLSSSSYSSSYSSLPSSSYSSSSSQPSSSSSMMSSSSSSLVSTSCPVVINNSDFYYKGGNVSVSNYGPIALNNIAIKIILPNGVIVSSSSGTSYLQTGNVLRFYISTIGAYSNIDTSYVHNYLGYNPIITTIECNQSQPTGADAFFKEIEIVS
jgi:hypothetical protein